jgi:preprotein translocase subunit SecB
MTHPPPEEQQAEFAIQKIYVKDVSFEVPHSPSIFMEAWEPRVELQMAQESMAGPEHLHEVTLRITTTVHLGDRVAYLAEILQAGIFHLKGFPPEHLDPILGVTCPNILFPFAREAMADLSTRGGFPQLLLAPVNFEAAYHEEIQRRTESAH